MILAIYSPILLWIPLLAIDVNTMTPIEALNAIHQLQAEARNGGGK